MLWQGRKIRLLFVHSESNDTESEPKITARTVRDSLVRPAAIGHQRKRWSRLANNWEAGGAKGLFTVVEKVLSTSRVESSTVAIDLGTGTGQLALPLAQKAAKVWAVDISQSMLDLLLENAKAQGITNIETMACAIETIEFPAQSIDLVVTNYVLHHLLDSDKAQTVRKIAQWLKPGGQLVMGDMMFGRGSDSRDRQIILNKIVQMARKGPAGWWRIAKNIWRFSARIQERPVRIDVWEKYLTDAGFVNITSEPIIAEAVVMSAYRP